MELEKYKEKVFLSIVDGFLKISSSAEDNNLCLAEIERILNVSDEQELIRMTSVGFCCDILVNL